MVTDSIEPVERVSIPKLGFLPERVFPDFGMDLELFTAAREGPMSISTIRLTTTMTFVVTEFVAGVFTTQLPSHLSERAVAWAAKSTRRTEQ